MTEQEINEGNKQIEQHNKFCFIKKPLTKYKKIVPLKVIIMYYILSMALLALPTIFSVNSVHCYGPPRKCQTYNEDRTRKYRVEILNEILKVVDKLLS